jgi:protein-S-isoprenylcysteine O-methyltransferase Ste14
MAGTAGDAGGAAVPRWLRLRPPLLALALLTLALALHGAALGAAAPLGRSLLAGGVLAAGGAAWMLWAWWAFRTAGTPVRPTEVPLVLVEEGPYRYGRNPMYLGMAAVLLGLGIALGVPVLALTALLFVAVVRRVHVPFEEAQLQRRFGGWYGDYRARVRRWI